MDKGPIEIADSVYLINPLKGSLLGTNTYLRVFKNEKENVNMLIDPGPVEKIEDIVEGINQIIGDIRKINFIFINHQDPDITSSLSFFLKINPRIIILSSEDTWRLVRLYGINSDRFRAVEKFRNMRAALSTGHKIRFVPTPFCHFRGAVALYDESNRCLFTGDLFGGLIFKNLEDIFASEEDFEGVKIFHQIYMPSKDALSYAIKSIKSLTPSPVIIAPQHGKVISGSLITTFYKLISELPVGLDLALQKFKTDTYITAMNEILKEGAQLIGKSVEELINIFKTDESFPDIVVYNNNYEITEIKIDPQTAFEKLCEFLLRNSGSAKERIRTLILKITTVFNIPEPSLTMDKNIEIDESELFEI